MILLLVFLILLAIGLWLFVGYHRRAKARQYNPIHAANVQRLANEIEQLQLRIYIPGQKNSEYAISLKEISMLIDHASKLSEEHFEDYRIFFNNAAFQLLAFDAYLANGLLPETIRHELKELHNTGFTTALEASDCFVLTTDPVPDHSTPLLAGSGEAFGSWQELKESTHNLFYLVNQWLTENSQAAIR